MKKLICVTSKDIAEKLATLGYRYMTQKMNERDVYTFVETDDLLNLLNDKSKFDKKHWYSDKRLRF